MISKLTINKITELNIVFEYTQKLFFLCNGYTFSITICSGSVIIVGIILYVSKQHD